MINHFNLIIATYQDFPRTPTEVLPPELIALKAYST